MKVNFLITLLCGLLLVFSSCKKSEIEEEKPASQFYSGDWMISFDDIIDNIGTYNRTSDSIKVVSEGNKITVLLPTNIIKQTNRYCSFPVEEPFYITIILNGEKYQITNKQIWTDSSFCYSTAQNGYREEVDCVYVDLRFKDSNGKEHDFQLGYDGRQNRN